MAHIMTRREQCQFQSKRFGSEIHHTTNGMQSTNYDQFTADNMPAKQRQKWGSFQQEAPTRNYYNVFAGCRLGSEKLAVRSW